MLLLSGMVLINIVGSFLTDKSGTVLLNLSGSTKRVSSGIVLIDLSGSVLYFCLVVSYRPVW